ncbi:hypothetical protein B0H34DRAFT_676989 [Crassisporium funariophilum]|nr:hypothetical protein B0H34DRAFT_676989 [Crassisporium funariophilum]
MVNQRNKTKKAKKTTKPTTTLSTTSKNKTASHASPSKGLSKTTPKLRLHGPCAASPADNPCSGNRSIHSEITPPPPVSPQKIAEAKKAMLKLLGIHRQPAPSSTTSGASACSSSAEILEGKKRKQIFEDGVEDEDQDSKEEDEEDGEEGKSKFPVDNELEEDEEDELDPSSEDLPVLELPAAFQLKFAVPSDTMDISPKDVNVAYCFSTEPRTANFSHLKKPKHLTSLFQQAARAANLTKSKKLFSVILKDLNKNGMKKKGLQGILSKRPRDATSDSESNTLRVDGENIALKKKTALQWVVEVERDNKCDDHLTTGHHQLTKRDLGTWGMFLQNGWTSTTTVPPGLQLSDSKPQKCDPLPVPQTLASSAGPLHPAFPLSDQPEELGEDVTLFPCLSQWLVELNEGRKGANNHNFSQFADAFKQEKYFQICDIADLSITDICAVAAGIAQGTATKLVLYAKQDTDVICKKEKRRACETSIFSCNTPHCITQLDINICVITLSHEIAYKISISPNLGLYCRKGKFDRIVIWGIWRKKQILHSTVTV